MVTEEPGSVGTQGDGDARSASDSGLSHSASSGRSDEVSSGAAGTREVAHPFAVPKSAVAGVRALLPSVLASHRAPGACVVPRLSASRTCTAATLRTACGVGAIGCARTITATGRGTSSYPGVRVSHSQSAWRVVGRSVVPRLALGLICRFRYSWLRS